MLVVVTVVVLVVVAVVLVLLGGARLVSPRNPLGTVTPEPHCSYGTHTLLVWHTHSAHMANNKQHMALHGTLHHQIQVLMTHNEHLLFGTQCQTVIAAHPQRLLIWQTILNTTHIAHMTWHTKKHIGTHCQTHITHNIK